ncbi:toxin-antitoxin system toxin component, PIN family protein [Mesotoga sp. B105.6.4]|uniref:toxin-antitoxin system toxin component, PIN family protein n=1 Tax=Mesotoga sp. B105.6.4 TaxID=1582224 RepID=UPI0015E065A9|nr:toxin-antitoxin system toxin component, PIN family protein [Mesotoga sp. B105.6.4]
MRRFVVRLKEKEKYRNVGLESLSNFIEYYIEIVEIVDDYQLVSFSTDLPDNHFISLAGARDALLITGDKLCLQSALRGNVNCKTPSQYLSDVFDGPQKSERDVVRSPSAVRSPRPRVASSMMQVASFKNKS